MSAPKGTETGLELPLTAHHLSVYASGIEGEMCKLCDFVPLLHHFETSSRSPSQTPHSVLAELIPGQFFKRL